MRVLLSTIGSRGDVQPLVALAVELRVLGQQVRLCVPPDFRGWIEDLGMDVVPIGPPVRSTAQSAPPTAPPSPDLLRQMIEGTVAAQFETIAAAATECDLIVGATALQIAAPSIAEQMRVPYVFVAYCPAVLPSPHHPPPVLRLADDLSAPPVHDNDELWARDARRWNENWGPVLNARRTSLGLAAIHDVRSYVMSDRPWLASDPTLAPWIDSPGRAVVEAGAWMLQDDRPLSSELKKFLDAGDSPVYVGFGSIRVPEGFSRAIAESARALGRRVIVSRGWADLAPEDDDNCLVVDEVNHQALFPRVAAVVHHGGAGTTTAAARAGVPQVVIPQIYDQHYWARRGGELGIGTVHGSFAPTPDSLTSVIAQTLRPGVAARARSVATTMRSGGARTAASLLIRSRGGRVGEVRS